MKFEKLISNSDTTKPISTVPRSAVVQGDQYVYVLGGVKQNTGLDTLSILNLRTMQHRELTKCPVGIYDHHMAILESKLYVLGGIRTDYSSDVLIYDLVTGSWDRVDIGIEDTVLGCFSYNDKVFVAGGDSIMSFDGSHDPETISFEGYPTNSKPVSVSAPVFYFENKSFNVDTQSEDSNDLKHVEGRTVFVYADQVVTLPEQYTRGEAFKNVSGKSFNTEAMTSGTYQHILGDDIIISFNVDDQTGYWTYPLSPKVYAMDVSRFPHIDSMIHTEWRDGAIQVYHYEGSTLEHKTVDLRTLSSKTNNRYTTKNKSYSGRAFFNSLNARLTRIEEQSYVYGGEGLYENNKQINNHVFALSDSANAVMTMPIEGRKGHCMDAYDGDLIISGGKSELAFNELVQVDPNTGDMTRRKNIPVNGLYDHVSTMQGHLLVLAGGRLGNDTRNRSVFVYNFTTNSYDVFDEIIEHDVEDVTTSGSDVIMFGTQGNEIIITQLSRISGDIETKRIPTQYKKIQEVKCTKLDAKTFMLIVVGDATTTLYRMELK